MAGLDGAVMILPLEPPDRVEAARSITGKAACSTVKSDATMTDMDWKAIGRPGHFNFAE